MLRCETETGLHERLLFGLEPLLPISTAATLVLALLGALMGWPRLRNTLSGWRNGIASLLPLIVISPLTGLALTFNITFAGPQPAGAPAPMLDAVRLVSAATDPSNILFIAPRRTPDGPRRVVHIT
jgi:hypothetical protein